MVMVMGLLMPVLVGVDELPAWGGALAGVEGGSAAVPEAPLAAAPAAVIGAALDGADSLEQPTTSDPRIEKNAYARERMADLNSQQV
jgi:hypothetical protein